MRGRQLRHGEIRGRFVGDQAVLRCLLPVVAGGELGQVPVVITFPAAQRKTTWARRNRDRRSLSPEESGQQTRSFARRPVRKELVHFVVEDLGLSHDGGGQ